MDHTKVTKEQCSTMYVRAILSFVRDTVILGRLLIPCSLVILKFFTLVSTHIIVEHMESEQLTPNKADIIQGDYSAHTIYVNRYYKQLGG